MGPSSTDDDEKTGYNDISRVFLSLSIRCSRHKGDEPPGTSTLKYTLGVRKTEVVVERRVTKSVSLSRKRTKCITRRLILLLGIKQSGGGGGFTWVRGQENEVTLC